MPAATAGGSILALTDTWMVAKYISWELGISIGN